jgi:hypothetical protein
MSFVSGRTANADRRGSRSRRVPSTGRVLPHDRQRRGGAGVLRFRCRRCLARFATANAYSRAGAAPGGLRAGVSRTLRLRSRVFVCSLFANLPQIRLQGRHRDRQASFREHRGHRRPTVPVRTEGQDLGRQHANSLLLAQFRRLLRRHFGERLLQLQNRFRRELVLVVHRFSCVLSRVVLNQTSLAPTCFPAEASRGLSQDATGAVSTASWRTRVARERGRGGRNARMLREGGRPFMPRRRLRFGDRMPKAYPAMLWADGRRSPVLPGESSIPQRIQRTLRRLLRANHEACTG